MKRLFVYSYKWIAASAIFGIFVCIYSLTNHFSIVNRVDFSSFFTDERWIPFLPWTSVIYVSLCAQLIFFIHALPRKVFQKLMVLFGELLLIHIALYVFCPISYSRALYPTDNWLLLLVRRFDNSGNCVPSTHVSFALYFGYVYCTALQKSFVQKIGMALWSLGIVVSVLTTKQHYLLDVAVSIASVSVIAFQTPGVLRPSYRGAPEANFSLGDFVLHILTFGLRKL